MIFYKETNLKETSIGEIPRDWDIVKLGDASETIKGKKPTRLLDEKSENAIPYLTAEYMRSNSNVQWCERDDQNVIQVNKNDLLMIWDGSYSGDVFIGFEGALASTMIKITPNENLDRNFLHYFLTTKFDFIRGTTSGTGVPHVSKSIFENLLVPLPPLNEQMAIAEVLGVVDSVIAKTGEVIAKTERLKKGLMQTLLTRGIGHKEYKQTPIGTIPKEWEVVKVEDVAEIRRNKSINDFEKIAFIPMELIPDSQIFAKYEIKAKEDVRSFTYCEAGDLLLAKITPSLENGKQGIVPSDVPNKIALATTEVFPICCKGINRLFLFYVLKFSKFRNKIISSMIGTTGRQRASKESVERLEIPLPPIEEQQKIAEILSDVDKKLELERNEKARLERIKRGLMDLLLTGKIRVRVD
jgi:type I restriction enzyme S subunit